MSENSYWQLIFSFDQGKQKSLLGVDADPQVLWQASLPLSPLAGFSLEFGILIFFYVLGANIIQLLPHSANSVCSCSAHYRANTPALIGTPGIKARGQGGAMDRAELDGGSLKESASSVRWCMLEFSAFLRPEAGGSKFKDSLAVH